MKVIAPDDDQIDDLALRLAMLTTGQFPALLDVRREEFLDVLRSNRRSCQPAQLVRRAIYAAMCWRWRQWLNLVSCQRALLQLAEGDSTDVEVVLSELIAISSLVERFELGPNASEKQRRGLYACELVTTRRRYAKLVRNGEVSDAPTGLSLGRARDRKRAGYSLFAICVAWTWLVFITMFVHGGLAADQLMAYMAGSVAFSAWLFRGLFVAIRDDEKTVQDVNSGLGPQRADGRRPKRKR